MLTLKSFQVLNYKSIRDSGVCHTAGGITVLAGKNESGKSALLEALRDFDSDAPSITEDAQPLEEPSAVAEIRLTFNVSEADLATIETELEEALPRSVRTTILKSGLCLRLTENTYSLDSEIAAELLRVPPNLQKDASSLAAVATAAATAAGADASPFSMPNPTAVELLRAAETLVPLVESAKLRLAAGTPPRVQLDLAASKLASAMDEAKEGFLQRVIAKVRDMMPALVYFNDFDNLLPAQIPLAEAAKNPAVLDFVKVSGLDKSLLTGKTRGVPLRNALKSHSARVTGQFNEKYVQDQLRICAEADGENLRFGVEESHGTALFRMDQRSRGFQWFLSFYLKLQSIQQDRDQILLLDEPGLYLHAKAQRDVMRVLGDLAATGRVQVIYSTHSPYLIDPDALHQVRLIRRSATAGTRVENKIHANADADTLAPILTAIGLDAQQSLTPGGGIDVIVEGMSDYYYLTALAHQAAEPGARLRFLPTVGATKVGVLASLCIGWGLDFRVLTDADPEGEKALRRLGLDGVDPARLLGLDPGSRATIEDFVGLPQIVTMAALAPKEAAGESPKEYFDKHSLNKVLVARKLCERVKAGEVNFDRATIERAKALFARIRGTPSVVTRPSGRSVPTALGAGERGRNNGPK